MHYTTDVERVSTVLHREFNISPNASEETVKRLAADQFGYVSVHHVLTLGESRSDLGEWKTVAGLKAEVQVRTIGQHAWAAISHALQYKRNNDAPLATQRRLARLAGLLELVDEESERLRAEHETRAEKIAELLKRGVLRIPIDTESLQQYLRWTPHSKTLAEAATLAGFLDSDEELIDVTRSTIISELVALAGAVQLDNLEDLDSILRDNANAHHPFFTALIESSRDEGSGGWSATAPFFVMLSVLFSKHKLVTPELMAAIGWHESVASRVLRVARSVTARHAARNRPLPSRGVLLPLRPVSLDPDPNSSPQCRCDAVLRSRLDHVSPSSAAGWCADFSNKSRDLDVVRPAWLRTRRSHVRVVLGAPTFAHERKRRLPP